MISKTDAEVWHHLLKACKKDWGVSTLSLRRKRSIVAADELIRYYERQLSRIALHPEFAKEFAADALMGSLYEGWPRT
jgi:hypothetical protein